MKAEQKTGKRVFVVLLGIQAALELVIGITLLFSFSTALESGFGITYSSELDILGLALGLYLLLLTALLVLSMIWTIKGNNSGTTLGILLGVFLFTFGIATFIKFGDTQALYVDGLRGLITIIFAVMARKELKRQN
ncbi:MAG: hypothetical protein ACI9RU_002307 [Litorivivens sp.]|jgi:hypothetical protein